MFNLNNPEENEIKIDILPIEKRSLHFLRTMLSIRLAEQQLALAKENSLIGGPIHLGVGQEAIAVGVTSELRASDRVFGAHRSHAHILAMNTNFRALFSEILGRKTGFSKGMGGSMHLWDQSSGFYGSVPIVAGTVPLALGAGLAAKFQKNGDVAISYLGDGAMEEGVVHECLNLAKTQNIPIIFIVENNLFASHMHISTRQPNAFTSRFAIANKIPSLTIDGNDISAISTSAKEMINNSRNGNGPGFIELITYRWYGHVDWRDDVDVGVNRSAEDLQKWKMLDPVKRLKRAMIDIDLITESEFFELVEELKLKVESDWELALKEPFPEEETLLANVYSDNV